MKFRIVAVPVDDDKHRYKVQIKRWFHWSDLQEFNGHISRELGPQFSIVWYDSADQAEAGGKAYFDDLTKPTRHAYIVKEVEYDILSNPAWRNVK